MRKPVEDSWNLAGGLEKPFVNPEFLQLLALLLLQGCLFPVHM